MVAGSLERRVWFFKSLRHVVSSAGPEQNEILRAEGAVPDAQLKHTALTGASRTNQGRLAGGGFVRVRSEAISFIIRYLGGFVPQNNGLFCLQVFSL